MMGHSIWDIWSQMGFLAKGVAFFLILMSIYSLGLFIERILLFRAAKKQSIDYLPVATKALREGNYKLAVEAAKRTGKPVVPEVMVPLIATKAELDLVKERIDAMAQAVAAESGTSIDYQVGTMIELPRAALMAAEIAQTAEFFSFGTNDLTQTTFGISRDDAASFLGHYTGRGILAADPFVSIDREGVGELMRIGVERGRKTRGKLKVGICGEHGGDPASIRFCAEVGLDYVSCSPYRVPIARLAAAQAAIEDRLGAPARRGRRRRPVRPGRRGTS